MLTLREKFAALPRDARDTLFLIAVIGWVILPQIGNLPAWCVALAAGVLVWRGWLSATARPLPSHWWVIGLLAVAVGATLFTHRTLLGRDAGVTLIVVLLALKTLELRARRDIFVVFFLGFFTMLTNFFFSQSLLTAAAMLVALLGLLTALVNAHMPVGKPPLLYAAKTAGWMTLLGAPVMAVLFVLFPRFGPLWGMPGDAMSGRSGLSSSMQVGNMASLALDESIAMRVRFEGEPPAQRDLYFRGPVLSAFDGREWRPLQPRMRSHVSMPAEGSRLQVSGPAVRYEITLEPNNRPWILVLDAATAAPQVPDMEVAMTSDLLWIGNKPVTDLVRYKAESHTRFRHGPRTRRDLPHEYAELPAGSNPRTLQLAGQILSDPTLRSGDEPALVNAVLDRLRTGGYSYTLDPGVYGQHSADEFWFDRKEGFCEHIASAFVVLLRAMDIPARIVTGYQGGERNSVDGFWVVRQRDAHAWAEVWFEGQGWVRVDPTSAVAPGRTGSFQRLQPPRGFVTTAFGTVSPTMAASLRAMWDAVNNGWNQWVLNYTQSKQLNLLKDLGFESPNWEDLSYVLLILLVVAALAGAVWTLWDRRQHDPWLRLLDRVRRRLAKAGLDIRPTATPREIATAITARYGEPAAPLAHWLLRLEMQRYARSGSPSWPVLLREFNSISWPV